MTSLTDIVQELSFLDQDWKDLIFFLGGGGVCHLDAD